MSISVRFAGSGGQGAVLSGIILAKAAALYDKKHATQKDGKFAIQTQSYGPAVMGTVSKSDVKISDEKIYYPYVEIPDILVVMSEQAYKEYAEEISKDTIIFIDKDLVQSRPKGTCYEIPANRVARELGKEVVANMIMIGALCGITHITSKKAIERSILDVVPKGSEHLNLSALQRGYGIGRKLKGLKRSNSKGE